MLLGWIIFLLGMLLTRDANGQQTFFNEAGFQELKRRVEQDAKDFARYIEELHATRCQNIQLVQCAQGNYDECRSSYPNIECLNGENYQNDECGELSPACSTLYDFSVSAVSIPLELADGENGNPTDHQVIETICYTQAMDEWVQNRRAETKGYWERLGVEPSQWYFGSHTGAFRMIPAQQSEQCGLFDPRLRPWYVAASSGPKNIVMVLDTSGTMLGAKMEKMKEAAKRVVETLTVGDRIAIVPFSNRTADPVVDEDGLVLIATEENKNTTLKKIDSLKAKGGTNFYDAFVTAFDILDRSDDEEFTVNCNTAILFLTDGIMTQPEDVTDQDVLDLVSSRINATSAKLGNPVVLFAYSVEISEETEVHDLPSKLACSTKWGIWSKITADRDIVKSLSGYYRFFALGLGADSNEDFVAWVDPYEFYPVGFVGTTVSVPVYDRSVEPHVFLGVVGIDFTLDALDLALGIAPTGFGSEEAIRRIALAAVAVCPKLELGLCELESFRRLGAPGEEALCTLDCQEDDFVQIEEQSCTFVQQYPSDLWANTDNAGLSYLDRTCCRMDQAFPSNQCPVQDKSRSNEAEKEEPSSSAATIGGIVGGVALLVAACFGAWWRAHVKAVRDRAAAAARAAEAVAVEEVVLEAVAVEEVVLEAVAVEEGEEDEGEEDEGEAVAAEAAEEEETVVAAAPSEGEQVAARETAARAMAAVSAAAAAAREAAAAAAAREAAAAAAASEAQLERIDTKPLPPGVDP